MLALQITSTKQFMNRLLTGDCFYAFLLESATVTTFNTFSIDGRIHPEFYNSDNDILKEKTQYIFSPFSEIQDFLNRVVQQERCSLSVINPLA